MRLFWVFISCENPHLFFLTFKIQNEKTKQTKKSCKIRCVKEGGTILGKKNLQSKKNFFTFHIHFVLHMIIGYVKNYLHPVDGKLKEFWIISLMTIFPRENLFSTFKIIYYSFVKNTKQTACRKPTHSGRVVHEHLDLENYLCSREGKYIA